jgi:hypothetical protein
MSDFCKDEFPLFWEIPKPRITPFEQRSLNQTNEELINSFKEYPLSFFGSAFATRPEFNGSLYGYVMGVRGERPTVQVLIEEKQRTKLLKNGEEIYYNQKCFITQDDYVPTTENYVNNKIQVLKGRELRASGNRKGYLKEKNLSIAVSGSCIYKLNTPNRQAQNIAHRNQLIFLDIDLDFNQDLDAVFDKLKQDKYTKIVHRSFSGDGFVVIVEMSEIDAKENFKLVFKKLEKYYRETYNLTIDPSCSDIGRLRFLSYDPKIFIK